MTDYPETSKTDEYPLVSNHGKNYRLIERDGEQLREYESGVLMRFNEDKQQWQLAPGTAKSTIGETYDPVELARTRWDNVRAGIVEGTGLAMGTVGDRETAKAIAQVAAMQFRESPSAQMYGEIRRAAGWDRPTEQASVRQGDNAISGSPEFVQNVLDMMRKRQSELASE